MKCERPACAMATDEAVDRELRRHGSGCVDEWAGLLTRLWITESVHFMITVMGRRTQRSVRRSRRCAKCALFKHLWVPREG